MDEQSISDIEIYIAVGFLYDMGEWQGGRCGRRDRAMAEYHGDPVSYTHLTLPTN